MKGTIRATARWEALDRPGHDTCKLVQEPDGWMLAGHARFTESGQDAALEYVVRCDRDWLSRSADVTGSIAGAPVGWRLWRDAEGWRLNETLISGSVGCHDIDLGFSPATNLLPVRRLDLSIGAPRQVSALWLRVPAGDASVLLQSYERLSHRQIRYRSPGYKVDLDVHPSGFVTEYPEGWRGDVDAR